MPFLIAISFQISLSFPSVCDYLENVPGIYVWRHKHRNAATLYNITNADLPCLLPPSLPVPFLQPLSSSLPHTHIMTTTDEIFIVVVRRVNAGYPFHSGNLLTHEVSGSYVLMPFQFSVIASYSDSKDTGKAIPLQAWTGPEGYRRLRFPDFKTIGTWSWFVRPMHRPPLLPGNIPSTHSC